MMIREKEQKEQEEIKKKIIESYTKINNIIIKKLKQFFLQVLKFKRMTILNINKGLIILWKLFVKVTKSNKQFSCFSGSV